MRVRRRLRQLGTVLGAGVFVVVFNLVAIGVLLSVPPAAGVAWGALLAAAVLLWHLRGDDDRRKRLALVRLRPVRASGRWLAVAVGASFFLLWGVAGLIGLAGPPIDPEALDAWEPLMDYLDRPGGWLAVGVLTAGAVPLVEELVFRGWIQHTLERWWGPAPAILAATALFTLAHLGRPHWSILLVPTTLGLATGTAVWLARSIWPAIAIHALWNLAMTVGGVAGDAAGDLPAGSSVSVVLAVGDLAILGLGVAGWVWLLRGGRKAGLGRVGRGPGPGRP